MVSNLGASASSRDAPYRAGVVSQPANDVPRRPAPGRVVAAIGALLVLSGAGCASTGPSGIGTQTLGAGSDNRTITLAEIEAVGGTNALDVVARLHPNWLVRAGVRSRSTRLPAEIVIVTEGQYFGPPASLRQIPVNILGSIRYMTGTDATNQFPWLASGRHVEAAIIVSHRGAIP
jgi:hypothetical protein